LSSIDIVGIDDDDVTEDLHPVVIHGEEKDCIWLSASVYTEAVSGPGWANAVVVLCCYLAGWPVRAWTRYWAAAQLGVAASLLCFPFPFPFPFSSFYFLV
jgi:hypothetical protein